MKALSKLLSILFILGLAEYSMANVTLPKIFGDHMVLQQNSEVKLWGWAKTGEEVTVVPGWDAKELKTKASNQALWSVVLKTPKAGGPYSIKISGYNEITVSDILIGEVWLCSGQSNMEWSPAAGIINGEEAIKNANFPEIRLFSVNYKTAKTPQIDLEGEWVVCTPETMKYFSAIGYFFGKEIHEKLNVPVGLVNSSWGGTPAEAWMNEEAINDDPQLKAAASRLKEVPWGPTQPGRIYNAMIHPMIPFKIAGAIWYQGEANTGDPENYEQLLPALINNWREEWDYEFPFYYVQIAPWKYGRPNEGVVLRDAQRKAMSTPNTGMVVVSDIGNIEDIHPRNKIDVGVRLANWALNKTYGMEGIVFSGPLFKEMKVEKNKAIINFDYADNGLMSKTRELTGFQVAGDDRQFVDAKAKIDGSTVVVYAKSVKSPVAVRYEWSNTAEPVLFNKEGLPASSFRTDEWEINYEK